MEAVYFWFGDGWQLINMLSIMLQIPNSWTHITRERRQRKIRIIQNIIIIVVMQTLPNISPILVICDSSSIVTMSCQIVKHLEGNLVKLVKEEVQLLNRDSDIGLHKAIGDIPSQRPEVSSFQNNGMEECKGE